MTTAHATTPEAPAVEPTPSGEPATTPDQPVVEGNPYRFSTADFYRMVDLDILSKGNRASLWDGLAYEKPPKTITHSAVGMYLVNTLYRIETPGWFFSYDNSLTLGPDRSPSPDMAAIRGKPDDYLHRRPEAADAGLVIEMSDPILGNDVGRKLAGYAGAGIPQYWVLDLIANVIHVHSDPIPAENRYATATTFGPSDHIPLTLGGVPLGPIAASDLLPAR